MKKTKTGAKEATGRAAPSHLIDARIAALGDWRGETLARVRALIKQADPEVVEEVKWRKPSNAMLGVPVWEHDGTICTGETYKAVVKLTFARGAALEDPSGLFNSSLEGSTRRAIASQVLRFRTKAWSSFALPTRRMPLGRYQDILRADPGGRVSPRY